MEPPVTAEGFGEVNDIDDLDSIQDDYSHYYGDGCRQDELDELREARLRRLARRKGYVLARSRSRSPDCWLYGTYGLIDGTSGAWAASLWIGSGYGLSLDEIEAWLTESFTRN